METNALLIIYKLLDAVKFDLAPNEQIQQINKIKTAIVELLAAIQANIK